MVFIEKFVRLLSGTSGWPRFIPRNYSEVCEISTPVRLFDPYQCGHLRVSRCTIFWCTCFSIL